MMLELQQRSSGSTPSGGSTTRRPQTAPQTSRSPQRLAFAPGVELGGSANWEPEYGQPYAVPMHPAAAPAVAYSPLGTPRQRTDVSSRFEGSPNRGEVLQLEDITILKLR